MESNFSTTQDLRYPTIQNFSYPTISNVNYSTSTNSYASSSNSTYLTSKEEGLVSTAQLSIPSTTEKSVPFEPELFDYSKVLQREDAFEAKVLIPVQVYLVILMIIGVFGNTLVLYIYKFRFRRSNSRVFILSLAAFDLITCLFGMPFHILDLTFPYTFVWGAVCKILSYALTFTILGSIFVLDLIAIDRYRKICNPLKSQISSVGTKIISWVSVIVSAILAVPMLFLYDSTDVDTRVPNVTGKECYIAAEYSDTAFSIIYQGFNIFVFVVSVFIFVGLYIRVGVVIRNRKKFHESVTESEPATPGGSLKNTLVSEIKLELMKEKGAVVRSNSNSSIAVSTYSPNNSPRVPRKSKKTNFKQKVKRMISDVSSSEFDSSGTLERGQTRSNGSSRHAFKKQRRTFRITSMLFIITLIFVISFLPYLIIEGMYSMDDTFWEDMTFAELVVYNLLLRTYFINNMVNPIVYWSLDRKFKDEVTKLFSNILHCRC